ncbi:SpaA isopeptide-forming pilin-related protein [Ruminococcus bicirculans (ex Wegman et al. 2014)]|uniref:SpaA isopeptide-forming pilin-related protein n=1 Tax=Ruminococcus bicirculans (ex Wegman et al. 2014) TaxID=1160721 RepID=A0AAW6E108_9FIRM|nr:SpaA isopeptide-forming pilin-related protein [Ruminococcus bicirculans (ex Wegman et al. 2014)]MDB8735258.1 SpaA isopeptide-forming pilin-related protein [Ruminococcus bicirculans (ex Wegman et al. 2014)]MDB8740719.1 SpaA isopeptide-forming pilin-related protein [Ruminococcus bicirculans (ex Wegman et al. 2014)]
MKKKSLFKRLSSVALAFLLSLSALTQGITASAFSDKNQATQQWLSTWSYDFRGSGLPNGYDIETGKYNDTHFTGYFASEVPYFTTSDNNYAYCINFDKLHNSGTVSKQQTLNDYMKNGHIPDDMQYQIKEFCIYSYKGKTQYGYSKDTELCASSVMSQAVSARFFDESTTGLSNNETKLLNSYYYNGNNASAHHSDLVDCYKKMKSEMLSHYNIPSGTSKASYGKPLDKASYPAKYDVKTGKWTAKLKLDSLSQFSVSKPNSVTVTHSGSNMTITADNEKDLKNVVFTLTKTKGKYVEHIDECSPLILSGGSDVQEMVVSCYEDKDPVKAYLKITTPIGSAHLDKSFTDYFDNKQTGTADMYKAVKFQLACKVGDSYKFVKATGKDGSYSFTDLASQATDLTPNGKGDIDVTGLPEGDYEWREISTADGYMISSKKAITVTADKTAKTEFVNRASAPDKGKITIHKRDAETRADLAGAKFEVAAAEDIYVGNGYCMYPKGTVIDTITTGADGIAETTKALYKGYSYTVTEIEAPKGYSISDEPTQTIKLVEQQAEFVVDFDNEQNTIPFEITKTDISTGELIPDCTFEILNENKEQVITGTTDENGIAHFQLAIGKYFYREISAPDIYEIDDTPYPFEITENDDIVKAEMTNKKKSGSIKVTKTTTGNLNIEGIKFLATGISDTNKDLKFEATTNENGVAMFDKLVIGKYVITEDGSTVPAAYLVANEQTVTVEYNTTAEVKVTNEEKTGSIKVQKRTEGQKNVEGITFYLKGTSDSGREINIPATTDKDGVAVFENVPVGTYKIIEDKETVPYGYLVADEKEVKVEYAQTIDATILNNEQTGSITVHKTTEGQKNIEGIKFYLRGTSDTGREIDIPAITDENGVAVFENVPVGTYKIIEDKETVPYGYLVADEKEVKVEYAQTIDENILNNEQTGTVQVHKKTDGMTNIEGIRFILSGVSDTGREIRIEAVTDKDGLAKFEGVPVGTYTITEDGSTVPYGYLVADSKQVTVTYAQTVDADMFNEKVPDTPNTGSSDNDIDGRTVLGGVVVILAGAAVILFSRKKKER